MNFVIFILSLTRTMKTKLKQAESYAFTEKTKQDQIYSLYSSEICTATRAQYTAQCPQSYAVANAWWIS